MFTSSPLGLESSGSHYKIRTRQQVLRERPIPPERAGWPSFALGSAWATSAANSFECHRRAEETDRPSRDLQAQGLRRQMSGWPENWAQARPTSAARDRRPAGPFLGRRPSATPSAPGCVPGTGAVPASAPPAAGGGPGAAAGARSGLRSHPHPSAAPGVNGFALHPLGGALRVLGALTPARRRARSQWAPRGLWDETSGQGRRPTWVPPVRRPGAGRPLG